MTPFSLPRGSSFHIIDPGGARQSSNKVNGGAHVYGLSTRMDDFNIASYNQIDNALYPEL